MRKKLIFIIFGLAIIAIIAGILFSIKKRKLENNNIKIIDATYSCIQSKEKIYEDDNFIYYFPCKQSNSVFVKFPNGNKILVIKALEEKKVTIETLIDNGLDVIKEKK